jgi:hypothetical protein
MQKVVIGFDINKDVMDILVVNALAEAGLSFEERLRIGPAISSSLAKQLGSSHNGSEMANRLTRPYCVSLEL